ncbi:MAG: UDP-2,3-diacylglucosamine diphosphatase [Chitinophagales bacterium]|nr:UDP-2,3-diacylglucosamine diphosphatase [Chitinophagales bacterium]
MPVATKTFFFSDVHLGSPNHAASLAREKRLVAWLDSIQAEAKEIYIVGDLFDFWFEYRHSVPKGYTRILGKLAELVDNGIKVHFFTGNHDLWMFGYFEKELGIKVYKEPQILDLNGKLLYVGHGDGLGPGDHGYKIIKKIFSNKVAQFVYRLLHPDVGISIANFWSKTSRNANPKELEHFLGEDREWLLIYAKEKLKTQHFDYFVFGHRHLPLDIQLNENSRYINLGDWISYCSYAEFDGHQLQLKYYQAV